MDRLYFLNNVSDLPSGELFNGITQGVLTLDDLIRTGNLDRTKRQEIRNMIRDRELQEDEFWKKNKDSIEGLKEYIIQYPSGKYSIDAFRLINNQEQKTKEIENKRTEIREKLRKGTNDFTPDMIRDHIRAGLLEANDLFEAGIPSGIISKIIDFEENLDGAKLNLGERPTSLPHGFTEVYFWGMTGSGKTTALAALLSTASKKGYIEIAQGPGFNYIVKLQNMFSDTISILPGSTNVERTQYLGFTIKTPDENDARSVSLIELSGEIFKCFFNKAANLPFPSPGHQETFDLLTQYLGSENPKIHFFFIDYDKENKPDSSGYRQSDYLNAAAIYFKDNNIFKDKTEAIYVVLTKSDLMQCESQERIFNLKEYLLNNNYQAFINALRSRCIENSINGKRLLGIDFTLGEIYFKKLCLFDSKSAENILDILLNRIKPQKDSILDKLS